MPFLAFSESVERVGRYWTGQSQSSGQHYESADRRRFQAALHVASISDFLSMSRMIPRTQPATGDRLDGRIASTSGSGEFTVTCAPGHSFGQSGRRGVAGSGNDHFGSGSCWSATSETCVSHAICHALPFSAKSNNGVTFPMRQGRNLFESRRV